MMKALEDVPKLGLKGSSRLHKIPYGSIFNLVHGKLKPVGTPQWYVRIIHISFFMGYLIYAETRHLFSMRIICLVYRDMEQWHQMSLHLFLVI